MEQISTERLILRKLHMEDAEEIEQYASDYDVAKTTLNIPHPYPKGSGKIFVETTLKEHEKGTIYTFAIEEKEAKQLVGLVAININSSFHHGELGYWIGKPFWGRGYGTEAAKGIIGFGFEQLDLHKIFARAFSHNPASWKIMKKIGMSYEGKLKEHVYRWDEYYDIVLYGLLKKNYKAGK